MEGNSINGVPDLSIFPELFTIASSCLYPKGIEVHPFLVQWYNELVSEKFVLNYPDDTLALVFITGPNTFEDTVIPYVIEKLSSNPSFKTSEPLDASMKHIFKTFCLELKNIGIDSEIFHDFDLHPNRRPKVLVQTAAHVSGAVQYIHKSQLPQDIQDEKFSKECNLSGVAVHPKHGGWFAIRGVIILPMYRPDSLLSMRKPKALRVVKDHETIVRILQEFSYNWKTNTWRDIYPGEGKKYSPYFLLYLELGLELRWDFILDRILKPSQLR